MQGKMEMHQLIVKHKQEIKQMVWHLKEAHRVKWRQVKQLTQVKALRQGRQKKQGNQK